MLRLLLLFTALILFQPDMVWGQEVSEASAGVELCDCLPADSYLMVKKVLSTPGESSISYTSNVEVLITFLTAYGYEGPHAMNLSWPNDLVVGSADLTYLLTGFNSYPEFEETLCSWEVINVASHGWILEQIGATGYTEAYVHESTFDEFDLGGGTYGQCLLNSFDLEMVYLPDSVVRLSFVRKYLGNGEVD